MNSRIPENNRSPEPQIQWKRLAFFTLGLSALLLLYRYFAEPYVAPSLLQSIYNSHWNVYVSTDSSLQFSAPPDLNVVYLPEKIDYMRYIQSFQYDAEGGLQISVNITAYENDESVNIAGALQGSLHELSKIQGLTLIKSDVTEIQRQSNVISVQKGEFVLTDIRYSFVNLVSSKDNYLWQMTVTYPANDMYGEKIAQKMQENFNILH